MYMYSRSRALRQLYVYVSIRIIYVCNGVQDAEIYFASVDIYEFSDCTVQRDETRNRGCLCLDQF